MKESILTSIKNILYEFKECFEKRDIWLALSFYDIKARYKRTVIGPFWLTLGTAITVLGMGFVWSSIFGLNVKEFLPYVAVGLVFWTYISSILNEGCTTFTSQAAIIHNIRTSYFLHVMTLVSRNFIILLHNFIVIIVVFIICGQAINFEILWFFPALAMLILNSFWICVVIGIFAARYRDLSSIIGSVTILIMLATPIMWKADMLQGKRQLISTLNPFAHMISILREPLLGNSPSLESFVIIGGMLILGFSFALFLYKNSSNNIVYWI